MLELLLLEKYEENYDHEFMASDGGCDFDYDKFDKRLQELKKEFLRPYVIDNAPSGE